MKEGWTYKKLGELFPIVMGKTPPRNVSRYWDEKKETNNLWVSIADLSKYEGKEIHETKEHISDEGKQGIKQIPKGSLLVSFKLTLGKMAFAGEKLYTNEAIMSLQRRDDVDLVFLYYYFSFLDWNKIASGNEKVKGKTLNKKSLSEIPVAYIPLMEQHSIVARLDAAFAHIDALKANAEKQLAEARQLFHVELTECMRQKEGWEEKKLGEVCEVISGQSPEGKFYNTEGNGTPFYQGKKDFTLKYVGTPTMWTTEVTKLAEKDDILMSVRAPVGDVNFATQKICIGRGLAAIRTKRTIDKGYLFYYLVAKKSSIKGKEGVGFASINRKEIMDIDIQFPNDISEQRQIVSRLDALSANIKKLEEVQRKTLAECDALKQAMLREVFE